MNSTQIEDLRNRLAKNPVEKETLFELGKEFARLGNLESAVNFMSQAVAADSNNADFFLGLAEVFLQARRTADAACLFRQTLALKPDCAAAYSGLGITFLAHAEVKLALGCFRKALHLNPKHPAFHTNLADAFNRTLHFRPALALCRRAIHIDPRFVPAYFRMADALFGSGELEGAIHWLKQLVSFAPDLADAYNYLGMAYIALNQLPTAETYCRRAIAIDGHLAIAHFGLAWCLLATGRYEEGWREYEWRLKVPGQQIDHIRFAHAPTEPMRNGESLRKKTILVHAEQGFGDTIQFMRFLPELAKLSCRIVLLVHQALAALSAQLPCVTSVVVFGDPTPRYDYHVALCSLPRLLLKHSNVIPTADGYLQAPVESCVRELDSRYKYRVAFFWRTRRGNYLDYRSVPLSYFRVLFNISHIQFCSLAVDPDAQKEVEELQSYPNVYNIGQRLRNFSETAAVLSQVDLLITIDSAVAHLGGALGRPVWLILPSSAEWRWSTFLSRGGSDSPWYTSVRIFRALAFDDWDPVFVRIGKSLSKFLPDKHSEPAFPQSSEAPEVQ